MEVAARLPGGREASPEQTLTRIVTQYIRNELEVFHGGGAFDPSNPDSGRGFITDAQMRALNITIRRAVHRALQAAGIGTGEIDERFCGFQVMTAGDYMELPGTPELEEAFARYVAIPACGGDEDYARKIMAEG